MTGATDDRETFPPHSIKHKGSDINDSGNSGGSGSSVEPNVKRLEAAGDLQAVPDSKLLAVEKCLFGAKFSVVVTPARTSTTAEVSSKDSIATAALAGFLPETQTERQLTDEELEEVLHSRHIDQRIKSYQHDREVRLITEQEFNDRIAHYKERHLDDKGLLTDY